MRTTDRKSEEFRPHPGTNKDPSSLQETEQMYYFRSFRARDRGRWFEKEGVYSWGLSALFLPRKETGACRRLNNNMNLFGGTTISELMINDKSETRKYGRAMRILEQLGNVLGSAEALRDGSVKPELTW